MKLKKLIIALAIGSITLSNNVLSYANEISQEIANISTEEYQDKNSIMEQERLKIEQEILEKIKNSPAPLSEAEINPMGLPDIDPVTNPASDNVLTREVARQVGKSNISDLTQEDFNKIAYIYLQKNQITEIPVEIGNLTNLYTLEASNNQLTEISVEIGNLTNLQYLGLTSNQITEIPAEIFNLTNLKFLYLTYQNIRLNNKYIEPSKEFTIRNPISLLGNSVIPTNISVRHVLV